MDIVITWLLWYTAIKVGLVALSVLPRNILRENELISIIDMLNHYESRVEVETPVVCIAVQEYGQVACFSPLPPQSYKENIEENTDFYHSATFGSHRICLK